MQRKWNAPGEYREIVQIAAVRANCDSYGEEDSFNIFVRPVKNPELSEFFTDLTGITPDNIDTAGVSLENGLAQFASWAGDFDFYSYGMDADVIEENCKLINIEFPFAKSRFHNLRPLFSQNGIPDKDFTSGTIVRAFGQEVSRRPHDALNDVRTLLDGLKLLDEKVRTK